MSMTLSQPTSASRARTPLRSMALAQGVIIVLVAAFLCLLCLPCLRSGIYVGDDAPTHAVYEHDLSPI